MHFRQAEERDTNALCAVSLATGLAGADASHLYENEDLIGQIYSAPYVCLEPGLALVVEDGQGVAGFVVGVTDTQDWEERLEREWWPRLRARYRCPSGSPSEWSAEQRRRAMIHLPERTPTSVSRNYPAHMHLNLLPRLQGRGVGQALQRQWLDLAQDRGVEAIHVGVNRDNERGLGFWARNGFEPLTVEGGSRRTVWMGFLLPSK